MAYKRPTKVPIPTNATFVAQDETAWQNRLEQPQPSQAQPHEDTYNLKQELDKLSRGMGVDPFYGHPLFLEILEELKNLHSNKNRDYANRSNPLGNFIRTGRMISKMLKPHVHPPLASALCLVSKQIDAVYDYVGEGKTGNVESLYDKLRDIAVYTIIAMVILREVQRGNKDYTENVSNS